MHRAEDRGPARLTLRGGAYDARIPDPSERPAGPLEDVEPPGDGGTDAGSGIDTARFRQVLGHFATGVTVVTGMADGAPTGLTVQSFTSVSLHPPLVAVCPARASLSWPRIRGGGRFCANVLSDQQEALARVFATKGADKFRGVGWSPSPATGSPLLDGVLAWIDCRIEAEHDGGDHVIAVARVVDLGVEEGGRPLLFYRGGYGRFEL